MKAWPKLTLILSCQPALGRPAADETIHTLRVLASARSICRSFLIRSAAKRRVSKSLSSDLIRGMFQKSLTAPRCVLRGFPRLRRGKHPGSSPGQALSMRGLEDPEPPGFSFGQTLRSRRRRRLEGWPRTPRITPPRRRPAAAGSPRRRSRARPAPRRCAARAWVRGAGGLSRRRRSGSGCRS